VAARNPESLSTIRPLPAGIFPALYAHVPFCTSKCGYCDFFSVSEWDEDFVSLVLAREIEELEALARISEIEAFDSLYVGGGTPSAVPRRILAGFLRGLAERAGRRIGEFTVEANPESLDRDFLSALEEAGADRISLGIQTWDDGRLADLGRRATSRSNRAAIELLGERWKGKVSLDLMYGFPGQTVGEAVSDVEELLAYGPGHVSVYALTVEEDTPLGLRIGRGDAANIDENAQEDMRDELHARLLAAGYRNYEISNYALPGNECRHNEAYWRLRPYVGIGPAGVSTLPARAPAAAVRLTGKRDALAFARADFASTDIEVSGGLDVEIVGRRDFLYDYLLMGLRTAEGIDEVAFARIFGEDARGLAPRTVEKRRGLFSDAPGRFALTDAGRRVLNSVLVDLFGEIEKGDAPKDCSWPIGT